MILLSFSLINTRIFNIKTKRGPLFITWLVTFDCNLYCSFCSTHKSKKKHSANLSTHRAREVAHEIGKSNVFIVGFTGGEVFLWPQLFEIITILKEYGVIVYIVTNGLLLSKYVDEIIVTKVDFVIVSIDSDKEEEHDYMRKNTGLSKKIVNGINSLKSERGNSGPLIKSTTVLSKRNLNRINETLENLETLVDVSSLQPIVGEYSDHPHGKSEESLKKFLYGQHEEEFVRKEISRLVEKDKKFQNKYFKFIPDYWFDRGKLIKKIRCWSPFLRLQILPDGNTHHCNVNPEFASNAVGNIKNNSLLEIWNSSEMMRQREIIRNHKNNCICWTQDTAFNAILDGVPLLDKLPVFNKKMKSN